MFPSETTERMEGVVAALAKNERDQLQAGLTTSAAETTHAVRDAERILRKLKEARTALALPVYKSVRREGDLTQEERTALAGNDPVAGTEYREMATLFVQMHEFVCDVSQALGLRGAKQLPRLDLPPRGAAARDPDEDGPSHPPAWWPGEAWTEEAVRLMNARAQSLHDNTHAFTRPLRW